MTNSYPAPSGEGCSSSYFTNTNYPIIDRFDLFILENFPCLDKKREITIGEKTPEVFEELLDSFAEFVNRFPKRDKIRLYKNYLPSFALYFRFFYLSLRFYGSETGNSECYFKLESRKDWLFLSSFCEAAYRFHKIGNEIFKLIEKHYPAILKNQNIFRVNGSRADFSEFKDLFNVFEDQLENSSKKLEWEQMKQTSIFLTRKAFICQNEDLSAIKKPSARFTLYIWKKIIEEEKAEIVKGFNIVWNYEKDNYFFVIFNDKFLSLSKEKLEGASPMATLFFDNLFLFKEGALVQENGILFTIYFDKCKIELDLYGAESFRFSKRLLVIWQECVCESYCEQLKSESCRNQFKESIDILFAEDNFRNTGKVFIPIPGEEEIKEFQYFRDELLELFQKVQDNDLALKVVENLGKFFNISFEKESNDPVFSSSLTASNDFELIEKDSVVIKQKSFEPFELEQQKPQLEQQEIKQEVKVVNVLLTNSRQSFELEQQEPEQKVEVLSTKFNELENFPPKEEIDSLPIKKKVNKSRKKKEKNNIQKLESVEQKQKDHLEDSKELSKEEKQNICTKKKLTNKLINRIEKCEDYPPNKKYYKGLQRLIYNISILKEGFKKNQNGSDVKLHSKEGTKYLHIDHNNGKKSGGRSKANVKEIVELAKSVVQRK